jgi:hypothetical protein
MAGRKSRVEGLLEAQALFEALPTAAHEELAVEMGILGREILAAQKNDVAKDTGATEASLSLRLLLSKLKLQVGALSGANYRGTRKLDGLVPRLIEHGRDGQTVVVTRRVKKRRVTGNGKTSTRKVQYLGASNRLRRRGPNAGTPIGSPYKMRVKAQGARPFVAQPLLQEVAEAHLSEFWSQALTRAGSKP